MSFKINITELLAAKEMLALAFPIFEPLITSILSGDIMGAFTSFISGGADAALIGQFIGLGFKWGFITKAKNALPFKKNYNFLGFEISA